MTAHSQKRLDSSKKHQLKKYSPNNRSASITAKLVITSLLSDLKAFTSVITIPNANHTIGSTTNQIVVYKCTTVNSYTTVATSFGGTIFK